ncbi:hypothetical protein D3C73_991570 [compost metagenome]|jgi:hypothetical protein
MHVYALHHHRFKRQVFHHGQRMVLEHQRQPMGGGARFLHDRTHGLEVAPHAFAVHVEEQVGF